MQNIITDYTNLGGGLKSRILVPIDAFNITQMQADELDASPLSTELKENIRNKYWELAKQFPKMKRHRLMRKACELFHVKVTFEK